MRNDNVDRVILVTGDGDFIFLLDYVEKNGKVAKLVAICPEDTSKNYRSGGKFSLTYIAQFAEKILKGKGFINTNDIIINLASVPLDEQGRTNMIKLGRVK